MTSRRCVRLLLAMVAVSLAPLPATAQELALAKPRFIATWVGAGEPNDASGLSLLQRRVSLDLTGVPLASALRQVASQAQLDLSYDKAVLPPKRVSIRAQGLTVVAALTEMLLQSGLDVAVGRTGQLGLVRKPEAAAIDSGSIAGRVTDRATDAPISGAMIVVDGTSLRATSSEDGAYRLVGVVTGTVTLRVRYIGYLPEALAVTVNADQETAVDFALEKSAQRLDEVVTTGTVVPTAVKALPSPITLITASDIEQQDVLRTDELFRQAVPSAVAWQVGSNPEQTFLSVRGASSLNPGTGTKKVYLDGIEIADRTRAAVDPNSIERIEVIRGPQAATIYGSDALGGVMQIFTKRADSTRARPQLAAEAGVGAIQTPYEGYTGAVRQEYAASIRGGTSNVTYGFGGGFTHAGDWVPEGRSSTPSAFAGIHFEQDRLTVDLSGRYLVQKTQQTIDPRLGEAWSFFSRPFFNRFLYQEQTLGLRLAYAPVSQWRHNLTLGVDRLGINAHQTQARLTSPSDTLLSVLASNRSKVSIGYNTSVLVPLPSNLSASVTVGLDHYSLRGDQFQTSGAVNTAGTIATDPNQPARASRSFTPNTGLFAQAQLNIRDALFLTGGVRAEWNSAFGDDLGTPVSPRAGISYAHPLAAATIKLRASYGEGIHPPDLTQKDAITFATNEQLANPLLGPERQRGWDAGVDVIFQNIASFGLTYYDQRAEDLIALVFVNPASQDFQFQNVGRVRNSGFEFEGSLTLGPAKLGAQYANTKSEIQDVGPNYTGDLRVGEQVLLVPRNTAGVSLNVSPLQRTSVGAGLTYVGSWKYYDTFAQFGCFGETAPCRASNRDYLKDYPGFVKLNLSLAQGIRGGLSGFVSVDNLTNNESFEFGDFAPVQGRVTRVGLRVRS